MEEFGNLYFYSIDISRLSRKKMEEKEKDVCYTFKGEQSKDFWIFKITDSRPGGEDTKDTKDTIKIIKSYLDLCCRELEFHNMYFGIHGADWGIKSTDYKADSLVLEDFEQLPQYNETVKQTLNFVEDMKQEYGAEDCVVKVFSHTGESDIYTCFTDNFKNFLTPEKQLELFKPKKDKLETLFFEFRLCLATLAALDSAKNKKIWEETLNRIRFLLRGGTLKRTWVENIIVEAKREKDAISLRENHYTEESKVLGIGHFVELYGGDTSCIETCLDLSWENRSKDDLLKEFKKIVPIIKGILEAEQKNTGKSQ